MVSIVSWWRLRRGRYEVAAIAPATFWPGLFMALPVPGTTVYATQEMADAGIPINLLIAAALIALTAFGYHLATRSEQVGSSSTV